MEPDSEDDFEPTSLTKAVPKPKVLQTSLKKRKGRKKKNSSKTMKVTPSFELNNPYISSDCVPMRVVTQNKPPVTKIDLKSTVPPEVESYAQIYDKASLNLRLALSHKNLFLIRLEV